MSENGHHPPPGLQPIDVIIPTWNNPEYLYPCVRSLLQYQGFYPIHLIIVNNGHPDSVTEKEIGGDTEIIQAGANLGWEGGLKAGLARSTSDFVVFSNDDIFIPPSSARWAWQMLQAFRAPDVAAVGPSSNVVMGVQNIFTGLTPNWYSVPFLIGFFVMIRRAHLDAIGGIDDTLPGGDDLDLGIRFRQAGYRLVAHTDVFIYHHGFKTGERLHGDPTQPDGWNSHRMQERTDNALIHKHGFQAWNGLWVWDYHRALDKAGDIEADTVASWVDGETVVDLGCGDKKSVPHAIGVDLVGAGDTSYLHQTSVAALQADVFDTLPFPDASVDTIVARHIFEHGLDPVRVLLDWRRVLKPVGGRLIVACPNEDLIAGIPLDPTHKHAWTPNSFRAVAELCGFRHVASTPNSGNDISFVSVMERP